MNEAALSRISSLIKVEDDLLKIEGLRLQFVKEKTSIDVKLYHTTQEQIESVSSNLEKLKTSATKLGNIKANVDRINTIHEETVMNVREYDTLKSASSVYQTMMQVQNLYTDIANFRQYIEHINSMIETEFAAVSESIEYPLDNIYRIHFNVTQARNFLEYLEVETQALSDDTQSIIRRIVAPVRKMVRNFDDLLKEIVISITEAVKEGNLEMVTRIVRIIHYETIEDLKLVLNTNLKTVGAEAKKTANYSKYRAHPRNYKKFFYDKLEESLADTFNKCLDHFQQDSMMVYDNLGWLEDELIFADRTLTQLFPDDWQISEFIFTAYYNILHKFTMDIIHSSPPAEDLMQILMYDSHYNSFIVSLWGPEKMKKIKLKSILGDELKETVLDDYSKVIVTKMTEWNEVLIEQETAVFTNREEPPDSYSLSQTIEDIDEFDHPIFYEVMTDVYVLPDFKTTLSMLKEQADVAADSGYGKVLACVIENWSVCYIKRVEAYMQLIEEEISKYMSVYNNDHCLIKGSRARRLLRILPSKPEPTYDVENMTSDELAEISKPGLVEYLTALGNTYEINHERLEDKFLPKYLSKVHLTYQARIKEAFENTDLPSSDLNGMVIRALVDVIINDLTPALSTVFTSKWYDSERAQNSGELDMAQKIVKTIEEYMLEMRGYATYEMYNITFTVTLDSLMTAYLRIGYQNILNGDGKKIDPTAVKKHKSFAEAVNRDISVLFEGLDHLFSRKDVLYLVKSLSSLEFLTTLATCENVFEEVPEIWEHEILETYYDCSVEYVRGALLCRKDIDSKMVGPLIDRLQDIKEKYHQSVPAPENEVVTLNNFVYT
ncbi:hypothetical protein METBIDRAFT_44604 [Metschnikowia bicuspidata var. bicuspidata NRRL YB-4993]|uniref:Uncharacterized protein n=1 Tax=Metschnikowia bicuspidata var. bicuspidata NRRL YB-4993 TaxID=869754 RepID=A0A1A0H6P7_9ASCO|nr:hypothetical protein METBIDRAFT_44604 [Metschnikowia bicuspidata var. bicuspidata NRRL YB-4993]OBA19764.1 hypothetical protein METBIDRAFT_44604 [Metschnikowia bicuspidata var. bicuspidata NRRL YB-4993]